MVSRREWDFAANSMRREEKPAEIICLFSALADGVLDEVGREFDQNAAVSRHQTGSKVNFMQDKNRIVDGNSTRIDPKRKVTPLFENHVSNNYLAERQRFAKSWAASNRRLEDEAEFSKQEVDIIQT
ncbi:MAG: hypothetical protein FWH20_00720 [Oscillospiraceae bacterium]|nr:hypothetical protein [Oscillospiraceae bacterium]